MAAEFSLEHIFHFFLPKASLLKMVACTEGNINQTWVVHYTSRGLTRAAVLQRLSPAVFPDLPAVMANFRIITRHLAQQGEHNRAMAAFPRAYCNPDGRDYCIDTSGGLWRLITYIGPARTLLQVNARQAAATGRMLATFHLRLSSLDPADIHDPLPGFHDTPQYLARFDAICCNRGPQNKDEECCFESIEQLRPLAGLLEAEATKHHQQLVHADPKCSNFLFAFDSDEALSLIDLDTVRFGYLLHDLGDCLRSCCNQGGEEGYPAPHFDKACFSALLAAYLQNGGKTLLTQADQALLLESACLLIFELGLRFFTDYLEGSPYFICRYPEQNLHRAIVQFRLHASLLAQERLLRRELTRLLA